MYILLRKLQAIGLDKYSLKLMESYLGDRTQAVQVESFTSPSLHIGRRSVIQGSALSCVLYLIFTLDLRLYSTISQSQYIHEEQTNRPRSLTYIDDNFVTVSPNNDKNLQESLIETMELVTDYMANNKLMLNPDKSQLMVITKIPARRAEIQIPAAPKPIVHKSSVKILGIDIDHMISWKFFLVDGPSSISKQLKSRLNMLKLLKKSADFAQMKMLANGMFMSKLEYGAEIWASAPNYILKSLQSIQLEAARTVIGPESRRWSTTSLLKRMNWLSIEQLAQLTSAKLTHKILTTGQPTALAHRMLSRINTSRTTRLSGPFLLGPRPAGLGLTRTSKYQYRANAYRHYKDIPLVLKQIRRPIIFKRRLKRYLKNNDDLPTNRSQSQLSPESNPGGTPPPLLTPPRDPQTPKSPNP